MMVRDLKGDLSTLLSKVRKLLKIIKRRTILKEDVQEALAEATKNPKAEVSVLLDVATRWNSLLTMLDSAFKMKKRLLRLKTTKAKKWKKVIVDIPSDDEWRMIQDLVDALRPVEILTKKLCEENYNILQADTVMTIILESLRKVKTPCW